MNIKTRQEQFNQLFPNQPKYRWPQIETALFDFKLNSWNSITTLPQAMRETLNKKIPWQGVSREKILTSRDRRVFKAALKLADDNLIETVLMPNRRGQLTICLSSQIGCSQACLFCATGKMGLGRNLTSDEIIDQYRFWQSYLMEKNLNNRISNIVVMGMGEPLLNFENVKTALATLIKFTDIGPTKIMVSTIGIFPSLEKILTDPGWPPVRLAISLHGADWQTRKKIVPATPTDFFPELINWSKRYLKKFGNRRHHLSFEYIMIENLNDSPVAAEKLIKLAKQLSKIKINLIPCNPISRSPYQGSRPEKIKKFIILLNKKGVIATQRQSWGSDIAAACGQLVSKRQAT